MTARGNAVAKLDTKMKQQRCLDLAVQGLPYWQIAEAEGYASESGARKAVNAALRRAAKKAAETVRPMMVARAERLWVSGIEVMQEGRDEQDMDKFKAGASVADKALARLMRLHGLDEPAPVQVTVGGTDLATLKQEFEKLLDGRPPPELIEGEVVDEPTGEGEMPA